MQSEMNLIKESLSMGACQVIFTKADGSERVMRCTTAPQWIPEDNQPKADSDRMQNPDVQPVWDLEVEAWRAFRWDSVKSAKVL